MTFSLSTRNVARSLGLGIVLLLPLCGVAQDAEVRILDVPDYSWFAGCFGSACGNLMGYWDRNGFPDFYTGPTGGGVAPLRTDFEEDKGIRSLWASWAGKDGRSNDQPGHIDDYWQRYDPDNDNIFSYESTSDDPYMVARRPEHTPDCLGDFIGLSQKKWRNLNGECDGNIDAYSFVYWDASGERRLNYTPSSVAGQPARDIQSGLREWTRFRGYEADVFTQLTDFNSRVRAGKGFKFADLKAEIDAGYPVLVFLQSFTETFRSFAGMPRANPSIHGMLVFGYTDSPEFGVRLAFYRTSWGSGEGFFSQWSSAQWQAFLPVRGVIGFHPKPKIRSIQRANGQLTFRWDGPSSRVFREATGTSEIVHRYQLERASRLAPDAFAAVGDSTTDRTITVPDDAGETAFFRVRLIER